jgi:hypothetical protein
MRRPWEGKATPTGRGDPGDLLIYFYFPARSAFSFYANAVRIARVLMTPVRVDVAI